MFNPYTLMAVLYIALAAIGALDAALINFDILPTFVGIRWLRIHFITLGVVTQVAFGAVPLLVAKQNKLERPKIRWDIWLTLNLGLLTLLVGIPIINIPLITTGGTLIFIAVTLLMIQLSKMRGDTNASEGRKFYITGLSYLLLGIIVGTGLWQGWGGWLQMKVPLEVHIHANNWGFMSLVFAGLLIDLYPKFSGKPLASPNSTTPIFWMMTVGALLLVLGPWFQSNYFSVPGIILHLSATIWLVVNMIKPLAGDEKLKQPGMLNLVTSYAWIIAPVLVAPLIILEVPGFPGAGIEQNAPQALVYGWVLLFAYGLVPFLFRQVFQSDKVSELGGNWFSLITVHIGGVFLWVGIFFPEIRGSLHGVAYSLWFASILPMTYELWQIVRDGLNELEQLKES